jgi:hypothetical protein
VVLRRPLETALATLIAVVNDIGRPALTDRHVQRGQNQLRPQVGLHRRTDDPVAEGVQKHGQIQELRRGRDERDVRDPELIGSLRLEFSIHQVRCRARIAIALRGYDAATAADADKSGGLHRGRLA